MGIQILILGLMSKQMIPLFCTFLCRVCTTTRRKNHILSLIERTTSATRKSKNRLNKQNNNFAYAVHFFVHFFAVKNARLRRKNVLFHVLRRIQKSDGDIFLLFMNMNMVYRT